MFILTNIKRSQAFNIKSRSRGIFGYAEQLWEWEGGCWAVLCWLPLRLSVLSTWTSNQLQRHLLKDQDRVSLDIPQNGFITSPDFINTFILPFKIILLRLKKKHLLWSHHILTHLEAGHSFNKVVAGWETHWFLKYHHDAVRQSNILCHQSVHYIFGPSAYMMVLRQKVYLIRDTHTYLPF